MLTQTPETRKLLKDIQKAYAEVRATELLLQVHRDELRRQLRRGREQGMTLAQAGDLLGLSRQRIDAMLKEN